MAGYSGTPLVQKLGIKPGHRLLLVQAPPDFAMTLGELPADLVLASPAMKQLDVILLFAKSFADLRKRFGPLAGRLIGNGSLWVCWPKKAAKLPTDLDENVVRDHGLEVGLVDVKVCAVDETWSGLKFVIRLADQKKV